MLWALYTLGFDWEANDFFYFIADVAGGHEDLQVMYGPGGELNLEEQTLDHLSGYEGARPVRIGNDAYRQAQHDVWGALLDSVYLHTRSRDSLDERVWPILRRQVEWRSRTGASPTAASGRSAASPSTSPRRRCSAGWPATAAPAWPRSARTGTSPSAGRRPPTRSTPTSASTASTSAACSSSTTRPTHSTPRCC